MNADLIIAGLSVVQHELLLFCLVFFALGTLDDVLFDGLYIGMRVSGRIAAATPLPQGLPDAATSPLAVFVPAWQEAEVIGATVRRMQSAWGVDGFILFIGCYHNDPATIEAALHGIPSRAPVRVVVHDRDGPTTKGDCLGRLWHAMEAEERLSGVRFQGVLLHDAEDWVHADELKLHRYYLPRHAMVQIPVVPIIPAQTAWIAAHYGDEFAESHGKTLRVRHALGGSLPAAGVGCAFDRDMLHFIAQDRGGSPFSGDSLVEDYEIGLLIHGLNGRPMLACHHDARGHLIGTRALFPMHIDDAVRQKTRWLTGIALAGWDRTDWGGGSIVEYWMRLHDRRSVLAALVLAMGYILMALTVLLWSVKGEPALPNEPYARALMGVCAAGLFWRLCVRAFFTGQLYGWRQAACAIVRQPLANMIAILAAQRAVVGYTRHCLGRPLIWDKTAHHADHNIAREAAE